MIEGEGEVEETAICLHAPLHKARPDLRCLMHTHQPQVLALAMVDDGRLEPASQNALRFSHRIAYDRDVSGVSPLPKTRAIAWPARWMAPTFFSWAITA